MIAALLASLCRFLHRGEHLEPSPVGGYRCDRCGVAFRDWVDGGRYEEMSVQLPRPGMEDRQEDFAPIAAIVRRAGVPFKVIRFRRSA